VHPEAEHVDAILHYNHVTGEGYVGEGNHRIGIALELRVPVPLVIARSIKTAPLWPMRRITEPGAFSMRNAYGDSRFPPFARPSEIGLPVVDEVRQRVLWRATAERGRDRDRDLSL